MRVMRLCCRALVAALALGCSEPAVPAADAGTDAPAIGWTGAEKLYAVWGSTSKNVWAVGEAGAIVRWDGAGWSGFPSPTGRDLESVWGSASDDVWILAPGVETASLALHWDGSSWKSMEIPSYLAVIWGAGSDYVLAAGATGVPHPGEPVGFNGLALWTGGPTWLPLEPPGYQRWYRSIWGTGPEDVWMVAELEDQPYTDGGIYASYSQVYHSWRPMAPPGPEDAWITSIWGFSADDVWVVGSYADGRCLTSHWDRMWWFEVPCGAPTPLYDVWGSEPDDVWALGSTDGTMHWDGTAWSGVPSGTSRFLRGIWGLARDDVWAVGDDGTIVHWDGGEWSQWSGSP